MHIFFFISFKFIWAVLQGFQNLVGLNKLPYLQGFENLAGIKKTKIKFLHFIISFQNPFCKFVLQKYQK
ncbi:hypothetical protein HYN56_04275 [Flavobacterium crocinum]|uniref:Uncharacterized protein n=1 Tax=Flavobacterium crocinum TaxID=2183896 RepID=A0A2S1YHG7_9FLAO|nr:hypothetical protein HYN56_04275 [Flavobacterium crocinum]